MKRGLNARDRFLDALAASDPAESPEPGRNGPAWPGAASPGWPPPGSSGVLSGNSPRRKARRARPGRPPGSSHSGTEAVPARRSTSGPKPRTLPPTSIPRATPRKPVGRPGPHWSPSASGFPIALTPSCAFTAERTAEEEPRLRQAKLAALAEFAAGAGHELNNPLAVIVGRAQLLLAQEDDPAAARSFRAILAQAQRAHRILRDLMYVARPPEPRPRFCQPEEIVRSLSPRREGRGRGAGRPALDTTAGRTRRRSGPTPTGCGTWPTCSSATRSRRRRRGGRCRSRLRGTPEACAGRSRTTGGGSPPPKATTSSTPSTAAGRRAGGWGSACRGRPDRVPGRRRAALALLTGPGDDFPGPPPPRRPAEAATARRGAHACGLRVGKAGRQSHLSRRGEGRAPPRPCSDFGPQRPRIRQCPPPPTSSSRRASGNRRTER